MGDLSKFYDENEINKKKKKKESSTTKKLSKK